MGESWYKKCMPRVEDVIPLLGDIKQSLREINNINKIYVFGSVAKYKNSPKYRVKNLNLLVTTPFNSEDLISIDKSTLTMKASCLLEEGYDELATKFSKKFIKLNNFPIDIDHWALSKDNKLLHWGPVISDKKESEDLNHEAESYATTTTGISRKKLTISSDEARKNWYSTYKMFLDNHFSEMPSGWYQSEVPNIKNLLSTSFKI